MKCNVGGVDRGVRLTGAVVALAVAFIVPMNTLWQTVLIVVAAVALITGIVRYCPANSLLGIDSCKEKPSSTSE